MGVLFDEYRGTVNQNLISINPTKLTISYLLDNYIVIFICCV